MADPIPIISPSVVEVVGEEIQIIADADPSMFPNGLELMSFRPGDLTPLGRVTISPGHMVGIVPLGMSAHLRGQIRAAVARAQKPNGETKPPGLKR